MGAQKTITPVRMVLDTNVVLSSLLFNSGRLRWLRSAWQLADITPIVSQLTTMELLRVLTYPKFHLTQSEQEDLLAEYLPYCEVATPVENTAAPLIRDAADQMFLHLAIVSHTTYLVTGDADLLSLVGVPLTITIVTPQQLRLALGR